MPEHNLKSDEQHAPERRDMWYGISYSCDPLFKAESASAEEQIALAAIVNFQGMKEPYCSSPVDDDYTRGHRFASHYVGETSMGFVFYILEALPGITYIHRATVVIEFEWLNQTGADKIARTVGYKAHATLYPPHVGK